MTLATSCHPYASFCASKPTLLNEIYRDSRQFVELFVEMCTDSQRESAKILISFCVSNKAMLGEREKSHVGFSQANFLAWLHLCRIANIST